MCFCCFGALCLEATIDLNNIPGKWGSYQRVNDRLLLSGGELLSWVSANWHWQSWYFWVCLNTWANFDLCIPGLSREKAMATHSSTLAWKIPWVWGAGWAAVHGVAKSQTRLSNFTFTFHFHALEKEMAAHSSILTWRIPGTVELGGLPSMGLHRVGHDWSNLAAAVLAI